MDSILVMEWQVVWAGKSALSAPFPIVVTSMTLFPRPIFFQGPAMQGIEVYMLSLYTYIYIIIVYIIIVYFNVYTLICIEVYILSPFHLKYHIINYNVCM